MGFFSRVGLALNALAGKVVAINRDYKGRTSGGYMFSGSKFSGSNRYPSKFNLDNQKIREQSRVAYWDSTQAQAILWRLVDNVIGTGLSLESRPVWAILDPQNKISDEERHNIQRNIELRFSLWANSHEPDAAGKYNLYQLQTIEYLNRLRDGETINILRYSSDPKRLNPLILQRILPEQVRDPMKGGPAPESGRRLCEGIEIDEYGREIAIWVSDDGYGSSAQRVPVFGDSGRRFVLHPLIEDTLGAVRGTPLLANCVHELKKITDYTVAEIEAAIINALIAVWIEPSPDANASKALAGIQGRDNEPTSKTESTGTSQTTFDKPGLLVQSLKAGEKVQSFDTKRPNVNFGEFVRNITRTLSASKGIPIEVLEESFNANYSASRASLLLFWQKVGIERAGTISQFLKPIFEAWFAEEVKAKRIIAENFERPLFRAAWLECWFNGDKQPSIDPLKEANADDVRLAQGATTRERVAMEYNGSDAMDNMKRLKIENEALREAGFSDPAKQTQFDQGDQNQ